MQIEILKIVNKLNKINFMGKSVSYEIKAKLHQFFFLSNSETEIEWNGKFISQIIPISNESKI